MTKSIVGLFDRTLPAEDAIQELQKAGFDRDDISLLTKEEPGKEADAEGKDASGVVAGAGAGAVIGGVAGLAAGLGALAIPGIGPVVAAGPLAVAIGSASVGAAAGGVIGALTGMNIPENDAHYYAEGIRRGGALVVVRTDDEHAGRAVDILNSQGAVIQRDESQTTTPSGARVYLDGLEMDPKKSTFEDYERDYRSDFGARNLTGYSYEQFRPAYRYGYALATDPRHANEDWLSVENPARLEWEEQNPSTWDQVKDVVRYSWQATRRRTGAS